MLLRRTLSTLLIAVSVQVASPAVWAGSDIDVPGLLMKMADGFRMLDYHGQLMYEQNSKMHSVEIVHLVRDGKEYERVLTLDGSQSEIIREGKPVDCYQPGELILRDNLPQGLIRNIGSLEDFYTFTVGEEDVRIAGRKAHVLKIEPKDDYRFGYELAIDKESGLLLHSQMMSETGQVMEQFKFVSLQLGDIDEKALQPVTKNFKKIPQGDCMDAEHMSASSHDTPWQMDLPQGYAFCIYENPKGVSPNAMVYSDGLSTFTVFVNRGEEVSDSHREGSTLMYSRSINVQNEIYTVTVVGEIPEATAHKVASSLRYK